ncbi:hypothetical protein V1514DRAFT_331318 [Lipomyces japonicus]|uniref:uncharacterized protein n=1 Tax=Lipomyces japonicus TaxID=56871 RepID=UPI0034CDAF31
MVFLHLSNVIMATPNHDYIELLSKNTVFNSDGNHVSELVENKVCSVRDIIGLSTTQISHFVSEPSSSSEISPILESIVRTALKIQLSPMTESRQSMIKGVVQIKGVSMSILIDIISVYLQRERLLDQGFCVEYLAPMSKPRTNGKPLGYLKRPLNCFMLYRRVQVYFFHAVMKNKTNAFGTLLPNCAQYFDLANHRAFSIILGQLWKTEDQRVKDAFAKLAKLESSVHKELHPEYKFSRQKVTKRRDLGKTNANLSSVRHRQIRPILPAHLGFQNLSESNLHLCSKEVSFDLQSSTIFLQEGPHVTSDGKDIVECPEVYNFADDPCINSLADWSDFKWIDDDLFNC